MTNPLKISFVIATLGRPDSLANCLQSIARQTVVPHEVIVVVDGILTDEIQRSIDSFKTQNNIGLVQLNNGQTRGAPYSKNRGAESATGDVVAFVDDDIRLTPDWVSEITRGYEIHSDAAGVGGMIAMQEVYFHNVFYRLFVKARRSLFRGKIGKMSFTGMPYNVLVYPADDLLIVDFLHGGNMSFRREIARTYKLDEDMGVRDEFGLCTQLTLIEKKKLIYNSKAIAYHHHDKTGGVGLWGSQRLYRDFRDHVPFLLKHFNLKYLRLAAFTIVVAGYSMITLKPMYVKAIVEGYRLYGSQIKEQKRKMAAQLEDQTG